jgi:LCP family protein required for cell wall assembly
VARPRLVTGRRAPGLVRRVAGGMARGLIAALSLALLVGTGYGWSVYRGLDDRVVTSDVLRPAAPGSPTPAPDEPFTALLVGLDSRTDAAGNPLPPELLAQLRAGADEGQLHTDTLILLHVPGGPGGRAVAISIPRDSFVPLAGGGGTHKINTAYRRAAEKTSAALEADGVTGAELDRRAREAGRRAIVATVEDLTGVRIDHYAEVNLAGFVEITEALGGVPICLNHPVQEARSGVDLPAGPQTVRGADALAFVRQRRGLEGGDLDRIARQQAFLAGLANRLLSAGTLADPGAVRRLVDAVTRHVVLDRTWNLDRLVTQFRRMSGGDIRFVTIPTGSLTLDTPVDGIAVQVDRKRVAAFVHETIAAASGPNVRARTNAPAPVDGASSTSPAAPPTPESTARTPVAEVTERAGGPPGRSTTSSADRAGATRPPSATRPGAAPAATPTAPPGPAISAAGVTCVD